MSVKPSPPKVKKQVETNHRKVRSLSQQLRDETDKYHHIFTKNQQLENQVREIQEKNKILSKKIETESQEFEKLKIRLQEERKSALTQVKDNLRRTREKRVQYFKLNEHLREETIQLREQYDKILSNLQNQLDAETQENVSARNSLLEKQREFSEKLRIVAGVTPTKEPKTGKRPKFGERETNFVMEAMKKQHMIHEEVSKLSKTISSLEELKKHLASQLEAMTGGDPFV